MRWEDERYVRVYTRDTPDFMALSFDAKGLWWALLRKVDRSGRLPLGKQGRKGVFLAIGHLELADRLTPALEELLADGCVRIEEGVLVVPNYVAAQETRSSDRVRKADQRDREEVRKSASSGSVSHQSSPAVTESHQLSPPVTPAVPSRAVPAVPIPPTPRGGSAPAPPGGVVRVSDRVRALTGAEHRSWKAAEKRLAEGHTVETLLAVVEAASKDRYLCVTRRLNPGVIFGDRFDELLAATKPTAEARTRPEHMPFPKD